MNNSERQVSIQTKFGWKTKLKLSSLTMLKWAGIVIAGEILYGTIWPFILSILSNMSNGFVVSIKNAIAFVAANLSTIFVITLIISMGFSLLLFHVSLAIGRSVKYYIQARTSNNVDDNDKVSDQNEQTNINHKKRSAKQLRNCVVLSLLSIMFLLTFIYPLILRVSFEDGLDRIAPYVQLEEMNKLKSRWVEMDTYDELVSIKNDINRICIENGLKHGSIE